MSETGSGLGEHDISIIVLTWNQKQLTLECLESLRNLEHRATEIVVVDNGSDDGTVDAIREHYPEAVLIENGENLGFVGGNNAGIRYALPGPAKYIMLLNNDTALDPQMVDLLIAALESDDGIGIAGPKMLYFDQPHTIWCAGNRIDWRNGDSVRLQAEQNDLPYDEEPCEVDFITSCAICLRKKVIEQIGLLDRRFFHLLRRNGLVHSRQPGWLANGLCSASSSLAQSVGSDGRSFSGNRLLYDPQCVVVSA